MKLVCKSCKYKQSVEDRSLKKCPQCGSRFIKILSEDDIFGRRLC
ncbi:MAG: hypothetical protein ACFFDN_42490 [Candidatus Hodarchaeota archaeon]